MLFEMLTGFPPFFSREEENKNVMYQKIVNDPLAIPQWVDSDASDLVRQLLVKEPLERLTDPSKIRQHKFFKNMDWTKLENLEITPPFIPTLGSVYRF